jgi:serine protease Do
MSRFLLFPLLSSLCLLPALATAQPNMAQLLSLNLSMVQVSVDLASGGTGTGSGVVIDEQHVATNCHVLANARGVSVAKYGAGHQPIALKADWKHDLCLLKFTKLPFPAVAMKDSASLEYEQEVFVISYPNDTNVPQPSYGSIKALYPMDGSVIVRSNAAFSLGSSGGALFDQNSNLIGITTFKSPGRNAYYYSLPVEWIRQLVLSPELIKLTASEPPFWSLPEPQRPFFMRVVIPYQNQDWQAVLMIAQDWVKQEPENADAMYYLGRAEYELSQIEAADRHLNAAVIMNPRLLDAHLTLAHLAIDAGDRIRATEIRDLVATLNTDQAEILSRKIEKMTAVLHH